MTNQYIPFSEQKRPSQEELDLMIAKHLKKCSCNKPEVKGYHGKEACQWS